LDGIPRERVQRAGPDDVGFASCPARGYAESATAFGGDVERTERRAARDRYTARTDASV
jgi:hypothetical protein